MRPAALRRVEPDFDALLAAEGLAASAGPKPWVRPEALDGIRDAIKAGVSIRILHRRRRAGAAQAQPRWHTVDPLGLLYGRQHYLVAVAAGKPEPFLWALPNIEAVERGRAPIQPRPGFELSAYAARAFGVYQEEPVDVVWRFAPEAAESAGTYRFHPGETKEPQPDGALLVRFRAGGLREMCWHLFTWAPHVEVLAPESLRQRYIALLDVAGASVRGSTRAQG